VSEDPYTLLGVERGADDAAIRAAYRKLAKQHHPDLNPGNKAAEERFKAINAAYALLSDSEKRGRFDRGEIDAEGVEKPPERPFYRDYGDAAGRGKYRTQEGFSTEEFSTGGADFEDLLREAFGRRGGGADFPRRGADMHFTMTLGFLDAVNGVTRRITLPDGRSLDVTIPAGFKDGDVLRLKGQGSPGSAGGPAGDALIEASVQPHPLFRREGDDIVVTLPVSLKEAVLGAKVPVPTVAGQVNLAIPPNTSSGTRMRLKGRGVKGGHQYVDVEIVLPPEADPALKTFLESWTPAREFDPRAGKEGF
jgi:DnaJ-class molecular chaperone